MVPKVKGKGIPIITKGITLESIPLLLVSDPKFVAVPSLKPYCLLIHTYCHPTVPSCNTHCKYMHKELFYLPVGFLFAWWGEKSRVLHAKKPLPHLVATRCVRTKCTVYEVIAVDFILRLRFKFHLNARRGTETVKNTQANMLPCLLAGEVGPIRIWFPFFTCILCCLYTLFTCQ